MSIGCGGRFSERADPKDAETENPGDADRGEINDGLNEQDPAGSGAGSSGNAPSVGDQEPPFDPFLCTPSFAGTGNGTVRCEEGYFHRDDNFTCREFEPPLSEDEVAPNLTSWCFTSDDCGNDAICVRPPGAMSNVCMDWECAWDTDCDPGYVCDCALDGATGDALPTPSCQPATCTTDDDCPGESLCARFVVNGDDPCFSGVAGLFYRCQSRDNQCYTDADCGRMSYCSESWNSESFSCWPRSKYELCYE